MYRRKVSTASRSVLFLFVVLMAGTVFGGVEFKGATWYYSGDPSGRLFVNAEGKLQWNVKKPNQLTVRIPEQDFSKSGDKVEFALKWKSDGDSGCECANEKHFRGDFCNDGSIDCLAGTGDFRMGLYDSNNMGYLDKDALGTKAKVFSGYLGYSWRFFPHLSSDTVQRVYEYKGAGDNRESHTNMSFWERTKNPRSSTLLSTSNSYRRLGQPLAGGFELPLGVEGVLKLQLERLAERSVKMTIELNGRKYERTDTTAEYQPKKIDVFAIQFPNARNYDYVMFDTVEAEAKTEKVITSSIGMKLVRIKAGEFVMGTKEAKIADGVDIDESPDHEAVISRDFYMGATEVTNAQFEKFKAGYRKTSGKPDELSNGDGEAVIHVSWQDAVDFCKWLSQKENRPYRLPTEAEWEYACRAGTTTLYNTGDELPKSYHKNQEITTGPQKVSLVVGQNPPNAWGLHDMHGNVEEWCMDWYGPYAPGRQVDPVGRVTSEFRVSRGGSHSTLVKHLRSANRMAALAEDKHWLLGFRVVMGQGPKSKPLPAVGPNLHRRNVSQKKYDWKAKVDMSKPYFEGPVLFVRNVEHPEKIPLYHHNHLPCITWCDNGDLLTTWFSVTSRKVDKNSNGERGREMTILASRLRLGNEQWDVPSEFYKVPDRNMTGSALVNDRRGMLHYFNGVSVAENWNVNNILITKTSEDNGATWSPTRILNSVRGGPPNQPIDSAYCADDGRLVIPTDWANTGMQGGATGLWISQDRGKSWMVTEKPIEGIHAAAVDFGKGKFMALGRSKAKKTMPKSVTTDNGRSWQYSLTDLPGIGGGKRCVLRSLKEGPLLLVSFTRRKSRKNPNAGMKIIDAAGRERTVYGMYAALSFDDGRTWPVRKLVTAGGPAREYDGGAWTRKFTMDANNAEHMGYLAGLQTPDGMFHLISSALHYQFNLAWLKAPMPAE